MGDDAFITIDGITALNLDATPESQDWLHRDRPARAVVQESAGRRLVIRGEGHEGGLAILSLLPAGIAVLDGAGLAGDWARVWADNESLIGLPEQEIIDRLDGWTRMLGLHLDTNPA